MEQENFASMQLQSEPLLQSPLLGIQGVLGSYAVLLSHLRNFAHSSFSNRSLLSSSPIIVSLKYTGQFTK